MNIKTILTVFALSVLCHAQREDLRSELTAGLSCLSYQWDDTKRVHIFPSIGYTIYFHRGVFSLSIETASDFTQFANRSYDYFDRHDSATSDFFPSFGKYQYHTLTQEFYLVPRIFIRNFFVSYNPGKAFIYYWGQIERTQISANDTIHEKYNSSVLDLSHIHEIRVGYQAKRVTVTGRVLTRSFSSATWISLGLEIKYAVVQRKRGEFGKRH
jgi:hypothetical protein